MAIAFDATTQSSTGTSGSLTFAHTTSGNDRLLVVAIYVDAVNDLVTDVQYAGITMTLAAKGNGNSSGSSVFSYLYYLVAPTTGANNVIISVSPDAPIYGWAASYTGAAQTGQPNVTNSANEQAQQNASLSLTTTVNDCWSVITGRYSGVGATVTAGTNSTIRGTVQSQAGYFDTNGGLTPAGDQTMGINASVGGGNWGLAMAAFAPSVTTFTPKVIFY